MEKKIPKYLIYICIYIHIYVYTYICIYVFVCHRQISVSLSISRSLALDLGPALDLDLTLALALGPSSLHPSPHPPSLSFMHTSLFLSRWNSLLQAVAEQPSSADVGTTCGWLCCTLPGSQPPPCTPLPFCGISSTTNNLTS